MSETDPGELGGSGATAPGGPDATEVAKRHSRWAGLSKWNTGLATILAIIGTVIAYEQAHLAQVTNTASDKQAAATAKAADQESLVSLVGDIAALSESLPQTPDDEVAAVHEEMAVEAEQGLALVGELKKLGGSVPAIDNLELGVGFEISGDLRLALDSFMSAGTDKTDPVYRSKTLRAAAAIVYSLGGHAKADAAHKLILLAFHAFDGQRDVPLRQLDQNYELVDLWGALWSTGYNCPAAIPQAQSELQVATRFIVQDPDPEDSSVSQDLRYALKELTSCRAGHPDRLPSPYVPTN
jgi:hypothetical protein